MKKCSFEFEQHNGSSTGRHTHLVSLCCVRIEFIDLGRFNSSVPYFSFIPLLVHFLCFSPLRTQPFPSSPLSVLHPSGPSIFCLRPTAQILLQPTGVQSATFLSPLWLSGRPESFTWEAASPPPLTTTTTTTNPHTPHQPSEGSGGKHKEGRKTESILKSTNDSAQANDTVVK